MLSCVEHQAFLLVLRTERGHCAMTAVIDAAIKRRNFIRLPNHVFLHSGSYRLLTDTDIISNVKTFVKFPHNPQPHFWLQDGSNF